MKRVLVTGAAGFTGRHLAAAFAQDGFEVHGLDLGTPARPVEGLAHLHACNLEDAPTLAALVRTVQPQRVVHVAGIAFVAHEDGAAHYRTHVIGTRNLLEALAVHARSLDAVLLASSASVYGEGGGAALAEDAPLAPLNDYGVSKLAMEYVARLYVPRLPVIVARPFNYTGVGQSEAFLLPKIVAHARRRAPVIELGNLDVARDFSDVRTVVHCYRRLLEAPAARGCTVNVCSGRVHSLRDVLAMVEALSGHRMQVRVDPALVRPHEARSLPGSRALLQALIGPIPDLPLADTLRWMLEAPQEGAPASGAGLLAGEVGLDHH